ncbi:hypothetical protein QT971_06365 [Microcoleus sp. herbarium19]|uniref:hypothetical protein n=1 Tax=unclassified Microcoleus TaxID=2642155 RepID=UPI002FD2FF7B
MSKRSTIISLPVARTTGIYPIANSSLLACRAFLNNLYLLYFWQGFIEISPRSRSRQRYKFRVS